MVAVANVHDVAAFMLAQRGPMTTMKLHKLLYYAQAWSLASRGRVLFGETIKAWEQGPVVSEVFAESKGMRTVATWPRGNAARLHDDDAQHVRDVLTRYGHLSGDELSALTHAEAPWRNARATGEQSPEIERPAMEAWFRFPLDGDGFDLEAEPQPSGVDIEDEIAYLEGRGPDPWPNSSSIAAIGRPHVLSLPEGHPPP